MSFMSRIMAAEDAAPEQFRPGQVAFLLAGFALFMALRLPETWRHGRFLDEEVTVFFAYAWNHDFASALFRSFAGYWNLAANGITALLAEAVKVDLITLERAPYVTMLLGLAAQLLPLVLLLTGKASWLSKRSTRLAACLLVVLVPGAEEVYLNVVHIQFHLALCVGIVLSFDVPETRPSRVLAGVILFTAPLCGPGAILFLPLFGLRAIVDRDRGRIVQVVLLAAGAAIQLLLFYAPSPVRGLPLEPTVLAAGLFVRLIVLPIFGLRAGAVAGGLAFHLEEAGNHVIIPLLGLAAFVCFAALAWWSVRRRDSAPWLIGSALLVAVISFGLGAAGQSQTAHSFALNPFSGPRYNYLPLILLALAMLVLAVRPVGPGKKVASLVVILYLVIGALFFRVALPEYANGVSWPAEVATWRANHDYQPRAWPQFVSADLSGLPRACPATFPATGNPADPRYCESGWIAGFYVKKAPQD